MACQDIPVGPSSEEWRQLLQHTLGKKDGGAVAASLGCREVVVNVAASDKDQASGQGGKKTDVGTQKTCAVGEEEEDIEDGITHSSAKDNDSTVVPAVMEEPNSVLHVVAAAGDSEDHLNCARMIYKKASHLLTTAAQNSKGDTPLHCAARAKKTKMVECLIELASLGNKARDLVRMQNKRGETALHEAVRFDNLKMVQVLLSADRELAQIDAEDGTSPLYLACSLCHIGSVRLILHEGKDEPSYSGPRGQNVLHVAALQNSRDMTELLLQRNKDLAKQRDKDGSTPLHYAASAPDPFFRFTVNVFSASNFERTSLGFYLVPSTFLTKAFQSRKLAILFPQFAVVLHLLLRVDPASAFQPDNQGSFPVHVAASAGCTVSLMILFTRYPGCAGMRNADGQTFLHVAVQKKRLGVVRFATRFMLGPGRQPLATSVVNAQDKNGDTALHLAVDAGELYMCRLLIMNRHTNINLRNMDGKTPMDIAAGRVESGFYFGLSATRRILTMLSFANALAGNNRRDQMQEYHPHLDEKAESDKIKDFAQIVGIGSVLVSTATFAAALAVPGGVWSPGDSGGKRLVAPPPAVALAGTPVLTGSYVFDGFVISNTLAFICSTLATFTLVYCGVAAVDIRKRFQMVSFSLILLLCSARSFCAAFTFASYLLLAKVAHGTAMASCVLTSLALLDGFMFLRSSLNDMLVIFWRRRTYSLLRYGPPFLLTNFLYPFWPYVVIGGYLLYDFLTGGKLHSPGRH